METSPQGISLLAKSFAKAQGKFRTPILNRTAVIKKEGKHLYTTHYADIQEIIDCVKLPLSENDLSFIQTIQENENHWYLVLELLHASGESKKSFMPLNVNQAPQQLGGTLTYLKRYQLSAFFGLAADFDTDGAETTDREAEFKAKVPSKPPLGPPLIKPKPVLPPDPHPEDLQKFPEDDLDRALDSKPDDPANYVMPIGEVAGKRLIDIPEKTLVKILLWLEGELKKAPPAKNVGQLFEMNTKIKAFIKSMEL